jgi:hypothetical protein
MSFEEFKKEENKSIGEYKKSHPEDPFLNSYHWPKGFPNNLHLRQFNYKYEFGYADWSEHQQRIRIGVAAKPFPRDQDLNSPVRSHQDFLTADACTDVLHDVKASLLWASPDEAFLIGHWFSSNGHAPSAVDQIIAITNIEVNLSDFGLVEGLPGAQPDISCSQALNGGSVTIHDHRQKQ